MAHGSILGQNPTAQNTLYNNAQTSSIITANNVQGAIDQLFTSVSNGKQQIASAITDKGVSTSANDSFATMAENIGKISTGVNMVSATAIANGGQANEALTFTFSSISVPQYAFLCYTTPSTEQFYITNFAFTFYAYSTISNQSAITMKGVAVYNDNGSYLFHSGSFNANISFNSIKIYPLHPSGSSMNLCFAPGTYTFYLFY